ncbi:PAS modulated sigma54 specific transcriptional regulator, Fis family [Olavius sp. associated proteobacterium Delta 1]|nr:PAS modulated sigma54 specific transcriptional regulator, Fis family [Olavius sp. associated proteobacterium Delta 1]
MEMAKYWKTIVDTLQDGLMVIDPEGNILAMNPAAEKLTGYSADELVGRSCRILNCTGCELYGRGAAEQWCQLYVKGNVRAKKCLISKKDRRALHVIKNAAVLRDSEGQMIGAVETFTDISEIVRQQQEIETLRKSCRLEEDHHGLLGESPPMQRLIELIENVARTDAPVLIHGQSGTGKELVARAIHEESPRKDKPFIKVNCAALNENLLESELFGHEKGAYTGADRTRIGRFEAAHEGTIFLDEIGDIPLATQVKLLRVLEEKEIERVGDHKTIAVDVRIISATNKNLDALIDQDLFREDLFFRINVFPLSCPSLAERYEDIPLLVQNFIEQNTAKGSKKIVGLTPEAMEALLIYSWPGNVRELRNAIEYAFVLCSGNWIGREHLPPKIIPNGKKPLVGHHQSPASWEQERTKLINTLRQVSGNQSEAARILGVSRVTIWKRIKKYGIRLESELAGVATT